jgi:hypothetical protein
VNFWGIVSGIPFRLYLAPVSALLSLKSSGSRALGFRKNFGLVAADYKKTSGREPAILKKVWRRR